MMVVLFLALPDPTDHIHVTVTHAREHPTCTFKLNLTVCSVGYC